MIQKRSVMSVLVFLALFLLILGLGKGVGESCYYYPESDLYCEEGITQETATADCDLYADCDITQYFSSMACSNVPDCEEVDCKKTCPETEYQGKCVDGNGNSLEIFTEEEKDDWCNWGCCVVGSVEDFCQYVSKKWECVEVAIRNGLTEGDIVWITSITDPDMTGDKCRSETCQTEVLPATLKVNVLDGDGVLIQGATVEVGDEKCTTVPTGPCVFSGLNPRTYVVKVSKTNFLTVTESVSLGIDETKEINFTLVEAAATAALSGQVKDTDGGIPGAIVRWTGPTTGESLPTGADGEYTATNLVLDQQYIFTVIAPSYQTKTEYITLRKVTEAKNFTLEPIILQGVKGTVFIDTDKDGEQDAGEESVYGAKIYVDEDIFKGLSNYPEGNYEFSLDEGDHTIYATWGDYGMDPLDIEVKAGETTSQDLPLIRYIGECSWPVIKDVEEFTAGHVLGEEKVRLNWTKPCLEVSGYIITKDGEPFRDASPAERFYIDSDVKWGETYVYQIKATYSDKEPRESGITEVTITLGDEECEGKYIDPPGVFEKFCLVEADKRSKVWSCDEVNKLEEQEDCSGYGEWFCAETSDTDAECKNAGVCGWKEQGADPFGLYYDRGLCYGTQNYCYFDYTDTVVDRCESCLKIESCFDYTSKDACEFKNCLGTDCKWVDGASNIQAIDYSLIFPDWPIQVFQETGHGYCVEEEGYDGNEDDPEGDDYCSLCGPDAPPSTLFENYFCTAEVCSGLGRCFTSNELDSCESCGEAGSCYDYEEELECVGGVGAEGNPLKVDLVSGAVTLSEDSCGWGRCRWDNPGGAGTCIKDGDDYQGDDCANLLPGQKGPCERDNQAPTTKVLPEGIKVVSKTNPELTFQAEDNHDLDFLGFCLGSADVGANDCNNFGKKYYQGRTSEELVVDIAEAAGDNIKGEPYKLRFYSVDEYSNRESVKETFVFIDTVLPDFKIKESHVTEADTTDLTVYLTELNELMSCTFELEPILPPGDALPIVTAGREEITKEALFEGLIGAIYEVTVSCEDDYGNVNEDSESFTFDLVKEVDIIYPEGAVNTMRIAFEVETLVGARCDLYEGGTLRTSFISDDNKYHKTSPVPGFIEKSYVGTHSVICTNLLTSDVYAPVYFDFEVDFTGPETQIVLKEGAREVSPSGYGWEEIFVSNVQVSFECDDEGFGCDKTYYCLTEEEGFQPRISSCYKEFTGTVPVNDSLYICYYSSDLGGNKAYPVCGKIVLDGYGITLIKPPEYYYLGEKWGISNLLEFDWEIMTKVPTQECRFDWNEWFDYEKVTLSNIFDRINEHYLIEDFPTSVFSDYDEGGETKTTYVKCKNLEDEIGPAQKINLEYDPTAPEILEAYAEPDPVLEGVETTIHVNTNDKTLCRYDEGEAEYITMQWSFPGEEDNILETEHEDIFDINFVSPDGKKQYNMSTQCRNGAENLSEVKNFTFDVDYTISGAIISLEPSGYIASTAVTLRVLTNKNAVCKYDGNVFEVTQGTEHTQAVSGLSEGKHTYIIKCRVGENDREEKIEFTVDLTAPVISEVNDQNVSCSLSKTPNVFVYTDEEVINSYYYELYDEGNVSSSTDVLVDNGTVNAEIPFKIDFDLIENHTYSFKIRAEDAAGNWGTFKESNGFLAIPSSYDICVNDVDAPDVTFVIDDSSCTEVLVEMYYDDDTGCDIFDYGESFVSSSCEAIDGYNGQQISFEKTGWLCYYVEDGMGNDDQGIKRIDFPDEDGDGITDSCDECPDTGAGKLADEMGCASGQVSDSEKDKDIDGDGLPDYWEKLYDGCGMDYMNEDADFDGTLDGDEDYDGDGMTSYEEFMAGYDPCVAEELVTECNIDADCQEGEVCEDGECESKAALVPFGEEPVSVLAWTLFILGWLMVLGGSGYLVYYYKFAPKKAVAARAAVPRVTPAAGVIAPWKKRLLALRKTRQGKMKTREREKLFRGFGRESTRIPHVEEAIRRKGPHLKRLGELAKKHAEVKGMVKPGLKPEEKGVFAKLEKIAEKTKKKDIEDVVSRKEAKNIFDKLKKISKERKTS